MENIYLQPSEVKLTATPQEIALTAQNSDIAVNVAPSETPLTIEPQNVNLEIQPNSVNLEILTGATVNNYYTSGGKITVEFNHTDFGTAKTVGEITSGRVIINTVVEITAAFDSGSFTIGKDTAQAYLMAIADRANVVNRYLVNNYLETTTTDNYKIFFSGSPSQGSGKVYITFA